MRLFKLNKGIYSLKGYPPSRAENIAILVHPLFLQKSPLLADYYRNLAEFLRRFNGPIVVLEEKGKIERSAEHFGRLAPWREFYFVETFADSPRPVGFFGWRRFFNFINSFAPKQILMGGGFFWHDHDPRRSGCLGYTFYLLSRRYERVSLLCDLVFGDALENRVYPLHSLEDVQYNSYQSLDRRIERLRDLIN
jgi:hypothetical protein